jgi:3-dehydroquinate dehydratase
MSAIVESPTPSSVSRKRTATLSERRLASGAIALIIVGLVGFNLVAYPLGVFSIGQLQEGSTAAEWQKYLAAPVPDVLFIGDSRTRLDVQPPQLSAALTQLANRPITVGRIGISSGRPEFFEAVAYRVMSLPVHPKAVIIGIAEFQLNATYGIDFSSDYWQLSWPIDPGYISFSYQANPEPRHPVLTRNYLLPGLVDAHAIGEEARCLVLSPFPKTLLIKQAEWTGQTCQLASDDVNSVMDSAMEKEIRDAYAGAHLYDYRVSQDELRHLMNVVDRFRNAGIRVMFVNYPMYFIETINPAGYALFNSAMSELSNSLAVPFIDLHLEMRTNRGDWRDPSHLTRNGALKWTPHFAEVLVNAGAIV